MLIIVITGLISVVLTFGYLLGFQIKPQYLVRVLYKSGNSHKVWLNDFTSTTEGGNLTKYKWSTYGIALPLFMGSPTDIEAVYILKRRIAITGK